MDLNRVGMPVGGICCGQLYLRGDGKLWFWDIFNSPTDAMLGCNYDSPFDSSAPPVQQGFALKIGSGSGAQYFSLDKNGFANVSFTGQYPIGVVSYSDPACPVSAKLEAFSPFIPLNDNDSGIPATVMEFTLTNTSGASVNVEIAGWLQNAVCRFSSNVTGIARNQVVSAADHLRVTGSVEAGSNSGPVVYDDFERTTYDPWVATGTAFGSGPVDTTNYPSSSYQTLSGFHGRYVVNSHASAPGTSNAQRDQATGKLPLESLMHRNLGNALVAQGRVEEAIVQYKKAVEIKPDYAEAHFNLGLLLASRGRVAEAVVHYQKAPEIKPDYAQARQNLEAARRGGNQ